MAEVSAGLLYGPDLREHMRALTNNLSIATPDSRSRCARASTATTRPWDRLG